MSNANIFVRTAIMAFAAVAIMAPQAPALAKGKPSTSASSAKIAKPSPTRSKYSKKTTKRKAVKLPTAADVINARAAREYAAHKQTRFQRFTGWVKNKLGRGTTARNAQPKQRPGVLAKAASWIGGIFSKPKAETRRGSTASSVIPRLERLPNGRVRQRPG